MVLPYKSKEAICLVKNFFIRRYDDDDDDDESRAKKGFYKRLDVDQILDIIISIW